HGTYPFVTSSHPTVGGVYIGAGFRPRDLHVLGVAKAYTTRVGAGPFPTELSDETGAQLRERGGEFGTTTGRPRRCGWLDLPILRYAAMVNGLDSLAVTKLDVLTGLDPLQMAVAYELAVRPAHDGDGKKMETFPVHAQDLSRARVVYESVPGWQEDITGATRFRDLPKAARSYVAQIEESTGLPVTMVSVGPGRHQLIQRS
ncbi:MAG: adenylosuccinate synthetase, partial [Chloroflexi bacterium]|nr:adenylosuccinate synthetase [Chloroflexota bacterium]